MKRYFRGLFAAVLASSLVACGGGGGSAGTPGFSGGGGNPGGGGGGTATTYSLAVTSSSQTVTAAQPATVSAKLTTNAGDPVASQVVSFTTAANLGKFSSASALTDADGVATVTLSPATSTAVGADTVVATATVGGTVVSGSLGFQLTATNVTISSFNADPTTLGAYAQTLLTVTLDGTTPSTPVNVVVSSSCVAQGRATLTPASVSTSTGTATFTYRDAGCGAFNATDGLQASVTGTGATATRTLTLTAPTVSSIAFVSASPTEIYLRGSGFVENSNVTFQVRDANGLGVPNQSVTLEPTTLAGGLQIDGGSVPVTKLTDANGNVLVRINSGTVPTPVRVRATLNNTTISTVSSSLAIAVGLPSQQNFSLSQGTHNIEGLDRDGTPNTYMVIASDRLGNPVPEGTAINFVSEGGQVQAIRFTAIANGLASAVANFQSASPRPADGRVTVLAYALGEESFLDTNGDNVYTAGEDHQDLGDVFLDRLFNGSFNSAEDQFISLSITGTDPCNLSASSLLRLGVEAPSRALSVTGTALPTCVTGWGRAYVRKAIQTVFSSSSARLGWRAVPDGRAVSFASPANACLREQLIDQISTLPYAINDAATPVTFYRLGDAANLAFVNMGKVGSIGFLVADANPVALNPMAAGTTVTATATAGLAVTVQGGIVPSTLNPSGSAIDYSFDNTTTEGTITISVRSPSGLVTVFSQSIYRGAGPAATIPCP